VSGLQISDYRKRMPELVAQCYREVFAFHAEGRITPPLSTVLSLADWRTAVEKLGSRAASERLLLRP
jgi:NADPH2:quinone reductase